MVPEVVADHVSATRRISSFVEGPAIVRLCAGVMDDIVLENVVVAADHDRLVRGIVDQIMGRPIADAFEIDGVRSGQLVLGESPNVIIDGFMPGGRQRLSVTAGQQQAARARVVNVTGLDAMPLAALDANAQLADVSHRTGLDAIGRPAVDGHAVALRILDDEPPQDHVGSILHRNHR